LVNTPAFFALLPPVDALLCLDLGCGEGHNTRLLAGQGARIVALDVAESFIAAAAGEDRRGIRYLVADGAVLPFGASSFDVVTAFMSLMDVADPERTLHEVARVLRPGGFVQFSVVHPVISAPVGRWVHDESGVRQGRVVGQYFYQGPLTERWTFSAAPVAMRERHQPFTITYARRTLTGWLSAVLAVGLNIEAIAEPHASEETAAAHPRSLTPRSHLTSSLCAPESCRSQLLGANRSTCGRCGHLDRARFSSLALNDKLGVISREVGQLSRCLVRLLTGTGRRRRSEIGARG